MSVKSYLWYNGHFVEATTPLFGPSNRSFAFGDGFFETIHAYGTSGRHMGLHYQRIVAAMRALDMDIPTNLSEHFVANAITKLLNKIRIFGSAQIRIFAWRKAGGFFKPSGFGTEILIEAQPLEKDFFCIEPEGLSIDVYLQNRKPTHSLSNHQTTSSIIYTLAGVHAQKMGLDDCLLINDQNRLAEGIAANLFLVKEMNIFTPPLNEGCLNGVVRQIVIDLAQKLNFKVYSEKPINPEMLLIADEIFLTDAIAGIRWVKAFKNTRYFNKTSRKLCAELNRVTFPDQFKDGFSG